jgi:preprotein translocase subunit SecG
LVIFVIVCLLMTLLILMQRPKQEGLGAAFGGGVTDQVFGARTTNVLQRGTVYLGSLFFILSLTLAVLIGHKNKQKSILQPKTTAAKVEAVKPEPPKAPTLPKSLSEELPKETETSPETPADVPADAPAPETPAAPPLEVTPAPETTPSPAPETTPAPPTEVAPPATPAPAEGEAPKDK